MTAAELFREAFDAILGYDPSRAPSPTELNDWLAYDVKRLNNLNGRQSKQRIRLLRDSGFRKVRGRWRHKKFVSAEGSR